MSIYNDGDIGGEGNGKRDFDHKKRGEDGNKVIYLRIKDETLSELDRIANESNRSRNEVINFILEYGVKNIEIQ